MSDIEVRQKDPCRFCKERNLSGCSGACRTNTLQEKTFTIPEIKSILLSKSAINKKSKKATIHLTVDDLLAEFIKETI